VTIEGSASSGVLSCLDAVSGFPYCLFTSTLKELHVNRNVVMQSGGYPLSGPFAGHASLEKITIGDLVTSLPSDFISRNPSLKELFIPENIQTLGGYIMDGQSNNTVFKALTFESEVPPAVVSSGIGTFSGFPVAAFIYVPDLSVDTYKTAPGWEPVANQIRPVSEKPQ
jgi:hypothetical protein